MSRLIFADGRKYTSPPPAKNRKGMEALLGQAINRLRAGPPSPFQQLRELSERHAREDADIRAARRCAACVPHAGVWARAAIAGALRPAMTAEAEAQTHQRHRHSVTPRRRSPY